MRRDRLYRGQNELTTNIKYEFVSEDNERIVTCEDGIMFKKSKDEFYEVFNDLPASLYEILEGCRAVGCRSNVMIPAYDEQGKAFGTKRCPDSERVTMTKSTYGPLSWIRGKWQSQEDDSQIQLFEHVFYVNDATLRHGDEMTHVYSDEVDTLADKLKEAGMDECKIDAVKQYVSRVDHLKDNPSSTGIMCDFVRSHHCYKLAMGLPLWDDNANYIKYLNPCVVDFMQNHVQERYNDDVIDNVKSMLASYLDHWLVVEEKLNNDFTRAKQVAFHEIKESTLPLVLAPFKMGIIGFEILSGVLKNDFKDIIGAASPFKISEEGGIHLVGTAADFLKDNAVTQLAGTMFVGSFCIFGIFMLGYKIQQEVRSIRRAVGRRKVLKYIRENRGAQFQRVGNAVKLVVPPGKVECSNYNIPGCVTDPPRLKGGCWSHARKDSGKRTADGKQICS